jgi:hypothetical protein
MMSCFSGGRLFPVFSLLLPLLVVAACGSGLKIQKYSFAAKTPPVQAVVVLPPDFYFRGMQAYQVYEKWMDFVHLLADESDVVILAPDEFKVLVSGPITSLAHETDIVTQLKRYGVSLDNAVAVKLSLTESWQQASSVVSATETTSHAGRSDYESEVEFSADVFHVGTNNPILTLSRKRDLKGGLDPTDSDARPDITQFGRDNMKALLGVLGRDFILTKKSAAAPGLNIAVADNALESLWYRWGELATLDSLLAQKDDMERDAALRGRVSYRYPTLDRSQLRAFLKYKSGLPVLEAPADSGLKAGDRIIKADGKEIQREYQLRREVRAQAAIASPLDLEVLRDDQTVTVTLRTR